MEPVAKRRKALGRGLGALIRQPAPDHTGSPDTPDAMPAPPAMVPVSAIRTNPHQPREMFVESAIADLARSIEQKGILQPLLVRRTPEGGFELIAGERRFRAAQRVGMDRVPVVVRDLADDEMLEVALIENIQRENLNPIEEARAYRRMAEELHLTQEDIATRVGKERSTVANCLRLLQLPEAVQTRLESGEISAGHARAIASLKTADAQVALAQRITEERLSVRRTEEIAKGTAGKHTPAPAPKAPAPIDPNHAAAEEQLTAALTTRVRLIQKQDGSGKIEIEFYSLEELNGLITRLSETTPRSRPPSSISF